MKRKKPACGSALQARIILSAGDKSRSMSGGIEAAIHHQAATKEQFMQKLDWPRRALPWWSSKDNPPFALLSSIRKDAERLSISAF